MYVYGDSDVVALRETTSNIRLAVVVPSAVAVKPVAVVLSVMSEAGAFGSRGCTPEAECAVTVAATSDCRSSTTPSAPEVSSMVNPQLMSWICRVDGVATWSMVLMAVPVVTDACAAVVAIAAFLVV